MGFKLAAPLFTIGLFCVISGCSAPKTPPPAIEVRTVETKVPVPVPCLAKADIPAEPEHVADRLTGDARRDLDIVSASAIRLRVWGEALHAALVACSE